MKLLFIVGCLCALHIIKTTSLRCYVCNSIELIGLTSGTTTGCHGEDDLDRANIEECPANQTYCSVMKARGKTQGHKYLSYIRSCRIDARLLCETIEGAEYCFHSCQTDECNAVSTVPVPTTVAPIDDTTEATTTRGSRSRRMRTRKTPTTTLQATLKAVSPASKPGEVTTHSRNATAAPTIVAPIDDTTEATTTRRSRRGRMRTRKTPTTTLQDTTEALSPASKPDKVATQSQNATAAPTTVAPINDTTEATTTRRSRRTRIRTRKTSTTTLQATTKALSPASKPDKLATQSRNATAAPTTVAPINDTTEATTTRRSRRTRIRTRKTPTTTLQATTKALSPASRPGKVTTQSRNATAAPKTATTASTTAAQKTTKKSTPEAGESTGSSVTTAKKTPSTPTSKATAKSAPKTATTTPSTAPPKPTEKSTPPTERTKYSATTAKKTQSTHTLEATKPRSRATKTRKTSTSAPSTTAVTEMHSATSNTLKVFPTTPEHAPNVTTATRSTTTSTARPVEPNQFREEIIEPKAAKVRDATEAPPKTTTADAQVTCAYVFTILQSVMCAITLAGMV